MSPFLRYIFTPIQFHLKEKNNLFDTTSSGYIIDLYYHNKMPCPFTYRNLKSSICNIKLFVHYTAAYKCTCIVEVAWIRGTVIHPLSPGRWGLSPRTCLFTISHRPPQRSLFTIYLNFVHFIFWSDLLVSLTRDPTIYYTVKPHCSSSAVYWLAGERFSYLLSISEIFVNLQYFSTSWRLLWISWRNWPL